MISRGIRVLACGMALATAVASMTAGTLRAQRESEMVLGRDGTKVSHRPACDLVRDVRGVLAMTRAQAEARGLEPHAACDPSKNPPGKEGAASSKPAMVMADVGGQFYHRDTCEKLSKTSRRMTVTEASKKHWPCRSCKPPIRPRPGKADAR